MSLKAAASSPTSSFDSTGTRVLRLPVFISRTAPTNLLMTRAVGLDDAYATKIDAPTEKTMRLMSK